MTRPYDGKEPGANGEKNRITSIIDGMKLCIARKGQPEEIASMIAFLLSDESKYTTGAVFTVGELLFRSQSTLFQITI